MFVLTEKSSGGVYALKNKNEVQTVHVFEIEDDAVRYHEMLIAEGYAKDLEVLEVDPTVVAINCESKGYSYLVISPDELIIPPND
ncbi:hypothetical protein AAJ62_gp120 [Synechococcus phage ACG-2014g]|jgi:hypothetical protein|uniref:Uncharacterized protein n=1 Tax=Synechococcus phage ACG-2014g TaxID=1493512 RepID=A0A0E3FDL1_9CAUD|nr:hypothetical protein AAJ62_gp120 [Synechococcus phage ACG-2014g]AIX24464.1 hypothetical protein Syn7803US105_120 [Synechococcus phage ACG-2014g]